MSSPRVTVILSSRNHERFIAEAIQSVLYQTCDNFELFIIDDCSSDDSWKIIQNFDDPRITAIRNADRSRAAYGFNETIRSRAKGEFIAIHHSDDVWLPTKLEKQIAFLDKNPEIGAVFTQVNLIDEGGNPFTDPHHYYQTVFKQKNRNRFEWLRYFFLEGNCLCHPSLLARREVMLRAGLYDRRLGQITDFDLWMRICLHHEIHILDGELIKFRIHGGEANQSGETSEMFVRSRNEWPIVLGRLLSINSDEVFFSVFPEMRPMSHPGGNNFRFLTAIRATQSEAAYRVQFGLAVLYDLMADEQIVAELKKKYSFGYLELIDLSGRADPFQGKELSRLMGHLRAEQRDMLRLKQSVIWLWRVTAPARAVWRLCRRLTHAR